MHSHVTTSHPHALSCHYQPPPCTLMSLPAIDPHALSCHYQPSPCTLMSAMHPHALSCHYQPSPCTLMSAMHPHAGFHLGFFVWGGGGKIVCKDQLCVKHAKFLSPFLSINHQCTKKNKARVFIVLIIIVKTFWGGSWRVWGEASPPHPPDETLPCTLMHVSLPAIPMHSHVSHASPCTLMSLPAIPMHSHVTTSHGWIPMHSVSSMSLIHSHTCMCTNNWHWTDISSD